MILEHLNTSGVQQAHREDRISFTALTPWPGDLICAEGRYVEGDVDTGIRTPCRHLHRPGVRHRLPAPTWWPPPSKPPTPTSTC